MVISCLKHLALFSTKNIIRLDLRFLVKIFFCEILYLMSSTNESIKMQATIVEIMINAWPMFLDWFEAFISLESVSESKTKSALSSTVAPDNLLAYESLEIFRCLKRDATNTFSRNKNVIAHETSLFNAEFYGTLN